MKKRLVILLAALVLAASASFAEDASLPVSFREAAEAAGESVCTGDDIDYLSAVAEKDGKIVRTVTLPDDRARELYMAALAAEDSGEAYEAYRAYAWSLPVAYTEEITAKPKEQAELDALAGKTAYELLEEGFSFYGAGYGPGFPSTVDLSCGMFVYEFEVDASLDGYLEDGNREGLDGLEVKRAKFSRVFTLATDPDWLADGTYEPQVVPNITEEEAAAMDVTPPADEYTAKAWPLDAEGYADLLANREDRYGQVYMMEGVVRQVLSESPARVLVDTGGDGKPQPVVLEYSVYSSFMPEEGGEYRIYADVSSACYILPVLKARYTFTGPEEDPDGRE